MNEQENKNEPIWNRLGGCIGLLFVVAVGGVAMLGSLNPPQRVQAETDRLAPAPVPVIESEVQDGDEPVKIDLYEGGAHDPDKSEASRVTAPQVRHLFSSVKRDG